MDYNALVNEYNIYKEMKLKLDMTRGRPSAEQLDKSEDMLTVLPQNDACFSDGGVDCRNYSAPALLSGLPETKRLFAEILRVGQEKIVIGGNSSLNMMFDIISQCMVSGTPDGGKPWGKYDKISFLCPVPGYDRHFAITEYFGINMISVPMDENGPDMDIVERLAASDETVKGIWCNPKYSNPTGITFSKETVERFARLKPKAKDFRIFWDNAYAVHDLERETVPLAEIFELAEKYGNSDMVLEFTSTSKITYAGAGVCCVAASEKNVKWLLDRMKYQTIGSDKLNQLRHARLFKSFSELKLRMDIHRGIIKPKFDAVDSILSEELGGLDGISWSKPRGGYFIALYLPDGTAKKVVSLAAAAGLMLTAAGATHPYGTDEKDSIIRIAPTMPTGGDIVSATKIMCICVKLVLSEKK